MSPNLRRLLASLNRVGPSGAGWIACCPAHQDRSPSLSIKEQNDRILLHCFAGCSVEAICVAVHFNIKDLFRQPQLATDPEPPVLRKTRKQMNGLSSRLTPKDRERQVTAVLVSRNDPDRAFARALALGVEGELVQVLFKGEE
jgi:CHC2 zinc finger